MYNQQFMQQPQFGAPVYGQFAQPFGAPVGPVVPAQNMFRDVTVTDPMTAEDLKALKPEKREFNMNLTGEEMARAKCPHKNKTQILLEKVAGNVVRCKQCGTEFDLTMLSKEEVQSAVNAIKNVLNQMKTYAINFTPDFYSEYMMMLALLDKCPDLYEMAKENFTEVTKQVSNSQFVTPNPNPAFNRYGFDAYQDIFNGQYGARYGVYNQTVPVAPQGFYDPNMAAQQSQVAQVVTAQPQMVQPMVAPQQQMFAGYTQPVAPTTNGANPFAAGFAGNMTAPMAMQQPPVAQQPVAPAPQAPAQPAAQAETTTTDTTVTL